MNQTIEISPPNSLLLIMDLETGEIPDSMNGELVVCTSSCVAIGTLEEHDGATTVTLLDPSSFCKDCPPVFEGVVETPNREISLCNVYLEAYITKATSNSMTNIKIWANDGHEPDKIEVLIEG